MTIMTEQLIFYNKHVDMENTAQHPHTGIGAAG